ncbi:MAG: long-chain fatty acid--CoA ligase [Gemmatimonadetes bacterium]|nr:long-chain fatty acid--CoA ligase [Gemmatimonadota bacterium]
MAEPQVRVLRDELLRRFQRGVDQPFADAAFDDLARRVFELQFCTNAPYAAYCRRRGRTPENVGHWSEIPAVPSAAFKEVELVSGRADAAQAVFRTSGTTRGPERRGRHFIPDLSVYHGALLAGFEAYVLPDGAELVFLSLVPPPVELPDSSLSHMVQVVIERFGAMGSGYFAAAASGIQHDVLDAALRGAEQEGRPVCLVGTVLAFAHWADALRERGQHYRLPPGSRLMDTGGFKGQARQVAPAEMLSLYASLLGLAPEDCVNEYGMTEMCSQFYDTVLRARVQGRAVRDRRKVPPPWVRTCVVDPETLGPLPAGRAGLLRHFDLANFGSVLAIQTEDVGVEREDGFLLLGRALGAPPRGCSMAMDLLLGALRGEGP